MSCGENGASKSSASQSDRTRRCDIFVMHIFSSSRALRRDDRACFYVRSLGRQGLQRESRQGTITFMVRLNGYMKMMMLLSLACGQATPPASEEDSESPDTQS